MPQPRKTMKAAETYLAEHGETQAGKLADALCVTPGTLTSALKPAILEGTVTKRKDGHSCYYSLGSGEPVNRSPAAAVPVDESFNASLWADGDLVLYGVEMNEDGSTVTLSRSRVAMLRRLLLGQGAQA